MLKDFAGKVNTMLGSEYFRKAWDLLLIAGVIYTLFELFFQRSAYIHRTFRDTLECDNCLESTMFYHDSWVFSAILLLLVISFISRRFLLYIPIRIMIAASIIIYIGDIATMQEFFTRLKLGDVKIYGDRIDLIWRHVQNTGMLEEQRLSIKVMAGLAGLAIIFPPRLLIDKKWFLFLLLIPVGTMVTGLMSKRVYYVHEWAVFNVFEANLTPGVAKAYSPEYTSTLLASNKGKDEMQCVAGGKQDKNIVLLVLESWSPFQSKYWSGINDWTPKIDKLAQQNTSYHNFHSGGFTTNEGLMSMLAGVELLAPVKRFFSLYMFETAWDIENNLPKNLEKNGYSTNFMTSGNLGFSAKGRWLENLGFDSIQGHDHPDYDGMPRLHFDSVPDKALYKLAQKKINELDSKDKPYFLTIENVSTHHPYIHPETKAHDAKQVFNYMDDTVDAFYQQLVEKNFFDDGMLIIVSDHRAMVPLYKGEQKILGPQAASMIPLIVINGPTKKGRVDQLFHQSDLRPTLKKYTSEKSCDRLAQRDLFNPVESTGRCVFHARGDNRDQVNVICPSGNGTIDLYGDETKFRRASGLSEKEQGDILNQLNLYRIQGDLRHKKFWKRKTNG